LSESYKKLSDAELQNKTVEFKEKIKNGTSLDDILPEAFATVREAAGRVLGIRHYKVQLYGGITMHQGRIAEMGTGEGKTLAITSPAYLNALTGEGVHVVTVNDYLVQRDAEWMGKVYKFLGLTVGVAVSGMKPDEKRKAYQCDITYATNNELGFDYLRDNMCIYKEEKVQRKLKYAIIDEVDSILIDEARTPLIISGAGGKSSSLYEKANLFVRSLKKGVKVKDDNNKFIESDGDFEIDEKKKAINLAQAGIEKAEKYFSIDNLSDVEHTELNHYINNALRANYVMKRDTDYVVADGEVLIVDEFTGRVMVGRRYSEGLHQAIEAKEKVRIQAENKTLATITFQNYFRLYAKLSGMTGTAKTEENEFRGTYKLDVVVIPPNKVKQRKDENDVVYTTHDGKLNAIADDIAKTHEKGQPVLVGTTTVEKSEEIAALLKKRKIPHNVLNAKNHAKEAEIVAQAGRYGTVTIATNMAGRGTDILLGGNAEFMAVQLLRKDENLTDELIAQASSKLHSDDPVVNEVRERFERYTKEVEPEIAAEKQKVIEAGGLRIIGTERHESRRIDNQLRGRAGRQGDVGSSIFYLSMEDDLLRLFAGERMQKMAAFFGVDANTPLVMGMLTKQISNAQKNIEGRNYSIRKHVLEYDNVMNKQRQEIYRERGEVLEGISVTMQIQKMVTDQVGIIVDAHTNIKTDYDGWDLPSLNRDIYRKLLPTAPEFVTEDRAKNWTIEEIKDQLGEAIKQFYTQKVASAKEQGVDFEEVERVVLLKVVDRYWMAHIDDMDVLRKGIGLKAYGQSDPVKEYTKEGFEMYGHMLTSIQEEVVAILMRTEVDQTPKREQTNKVNLVLNLGSEEQKKPQPQTVETAKQIGRNEPCTCGSGKKYKDCCGK